MRKKAKFMAMCLTVVLLLFGCGSDTTKITKEMYDKIETGMTLEEVEDILGLGEENAKTEAAGVVITSMQWVNKDGGNIQIMFQDGKVDTKAQAGLK
ncbi:outer membrane protein assembly factor BamE [Alkaliphilus sp. MSJ-5]|uniref:Outer membrane protein assembly factor BamE n=1 Tax=Alkaliphilus flagellatus TaxID=2841507 RepID=A0ABS6G6J4_9FIRM|nr:outer membrane protein assembly factor BamE [Alkaliphilus flagellatus]MBU5677779.1 outer membrane protein assembly factor BamE [Alkaliphilus flagellatus]